MGWTSYREDIIERFEQSPHLISRFTTAGVNLTITDVDRAWSELVASSFQPLPDIFRVESYNRKGQFDLQSGKLIEPMILTTVETTVAVQDTEFLSRPDIRRMFYVYRDRDDNAILAIKSIRRLKSGEARVIFKVLENGKSLFIEWISKRRVAPPPLEGVAPTGCADRS